MKTIRELLRNANSRITLDVYTHGDTDAKRNALSNVTGILLVEQPPDPYYLKQKKLHCADA